MEFVSKEIIAKIENINLEKDAAYSTITFSELKFNEPCLDELFLLLSTSSKVRILILPNT
jgi:hypothetical protein